MTAGRLLVASLWVACLDTAYLSWRYLALENGWVEPGTGICSWSDTVDCDKVLVTPEARAFFVPNALLGAGFFWGALLWWWLGHRLGPQYRRHVAGTLAFWLGVATLFTFRFWALLFSLPALCPFCPWNHVWTYVALGAALTLWRRAEPPTEPIRWAPLVGVVAICVAFFFAVQGAWLLTR